MFWFFAALVGSCGGRILFSVCITNSSCQVVVAGGFLDGGLGYSLDGFGLAGSVGTKVGIEVGTLIGDFLNGFDFDTIDGIAPSASWKLEECCFSELLDA